MASSIFTSAAPTVSLVAAITPTLPLARRSLTPSTGLAAMNFFSSSTTWATVGPSWFLVKIMTWMARQLSLLKPRLGSKAREPTDRPDSLRGSASQRGLPSLKAEITSRPTPPTLSTDCTPATPRMVSSSRSIRSVTG